MKRGRKKLFDKPMSKVISVKLPNHIYKAFMEVCEGQPGQALRVLVLDLLIKSGKIK